jgi:hypothetical protein
MVFGPPAVPAVPPQSVQACQSVLTPLLLWAAPGLPAVVVHSCPRLVRSSAKAEQRVVLRVNESMMFLLDSLCQLCTLQYDENQLDERNQPQKLQTEQLLDPPAVLKPPIYRRSFSAHNLRTANRKQVNLALESHAKERRNEP